MPVLFCILFAQNEQGWLSPGPGSQWSSAQRLSQPTSAQQRSQGSWDVLPAPPPPLSLSCSLLLTTLQGESPGILPSTSFRLYVCLSLKDKMMMWVDQSWPFRMQSFCSRSWPRGLVTVFTSHRETSRGGRGSWDQQPFLVQLLPLTSVGSHWIQHRLEFHIDLHQRL